MMALILAFTGLANARTLVEVGTGTATTMAGAFNSVWGYSFAETLYPASEIGVAGTITQVAYHLQSTETYHNDVVIYMKNVSATTINSASDVIPVTPADIVYQGDFDFPATDGWYTIELDTPFEYDGLSTLMIAVDENTPGFSSRQFYYTTHSHCRFSFYSDSENPDPYNLGAFTGGSWSDYYMTNVQLTMDLGEQPLVLTLNPDPVDFGARPNNCWMRPVVATLTNAGPLTGIYGVDVDNAYFVPEEVEVPFTLGHNESVDLHFGWTSAPEGEVNGFLAVDGQAREAFLFDMTAYAYEPVEPDVFEMARVIDAAFPFEYVDTPTTATLYDNYLLPPTDVEDGPDAVYKVTFNQDVMLNGNVVKTGTDEAAENAKMAVYTEDFYVGTYGYPGPDQENNYTGPQLAANVAPYDFTLGEGTTTTGYMPLYYVYNYSLSQQLYRADELAEAGMSTLPVGSISFYSDNTYGYNLTGTKIWMANVNDVTAPITSMNASNMTLVYDGTQAEVVGWNEFVLNGNFAWDGESNILVLFQSNRGVWSTAISWQCTTMDFVAGAYVYQDSYAYAPESSTYGMTTTTTRANTKFKSVARGNRASNELTVYDGTTTNAYVPVYGYYADAFLKSEYIIPASELSSMTGCNIQSMKFYSTTPSANWGSTFRVFMKEVSNTTLGEFTGYADATVVYHGNLSVSGNEMVVNFDTPYNYNGGNLLVGVYNETKGIYISSNWYGVNVDNAGVRGYSYSSLDEVTPSTASFLPKTTFSYEPAPVPPTPGENLINNMTMVPGTYYIVASSTEADWDVVLNAEDLPCPEEITAEANLVAPLDNEDGISPICVQLKWHLSPYTTEYRLLFGSTYYCEDVLVDWTSNLSENYTVLNLFNNTNYFWRIEERNAGCPQGIQGPVWGFTTTFNAPTNLHATNANGNNILAMNLNLGSKTTRTRSVVEF